MSEPNTDWPTNYFNYFTEIEEHFQRARGTGLFLLSPLDWALIESWKNSGIPLEAVLRGIDIAFERWRARKSKFRQINSLAYCAQEVLEQAQRLAQSMSLAQPREAQAPFTAAELQRHLLCCATSLRNTGDEAFASIAASLESLASESETWLNNLEELEQRLTALEDKLFALLRTRQSDEEALQLRRELENELRPYRSRMSAAQVAMLEEQYFKRRLMEKAGVPRLSLFYMR